MGLGVQGSGGRRIGDLLDTDDDVHGHALLTTRPFRRHSRRPSGPAARAASLPQGPAWTRPRGPSAARACWAASSWSVMTASTPSRHIWTRSAGAFTVQTRSAVPAARAFAT